MIDAGWLDRERLQRIGERKAGLWQRFIDSSYRDLAALQSFHGAFAEGVALAAAIRRAGRKVPDVYRAERERWGAPDRTGSRA